jgi:hypothetical protein
MDGRILQNGTYRTDITERNLQNTVRERGRLWNPSLPPPPRFHSFEDDIKEIGIGGTCSTYSEEINLYIISVKLSHVFSNPATRSARNKLVFFISSNTPNLDFC